MNYTIIFIIVAFILMVYLLMVYFMYKTEKRDFLLMQSKRPENIPIELRAYKDTFGITDEDFVSTIPYCLEFKTKTDNWWKPIYMFQNENVLNSNDKNTLSRIAIKNKEDLEKWKSRLKTLKDIQDFKNKQEVVMKLWEEKETNKNCIY